MVYCLIWFIDHLSVSGLLIGKVFGFFRLHTAMEYLISIGQLLYVVYFIVVPLLINLIKLCELSSKTNHYHTQLFISLYFKSQ